MSIKQISVFVESKPGHLKRNLDIFQDADISVRGYSCSDTGDYGIARFIVDEPERALAVLQDRGSAVTLTDVVCAEMIDEPGELARVFGILADANINITYSYSLIETYIAFRVDDPVFAEELLAKDEVRIITQDDLR